MKRNLSLLFFLLLAAPRLRAAAPTPPQNTNIQTEILKGGERKQETAAQAEKEAAESKKLGAEGEGADVTYEQVLENPDDIELNYRYARTQVRTGNLRQAASTLERILIINPNLPKVRLFYAVVLFRLDSLDEAEKELKTLKSEPMPQSLRGEVDQYVGEIRRRRRNTHISVMLGAGMDFDDNRNAAPALPKVQVAGFVGGFDLDGASTRKSDVAKTMLANISASHDLGYQAGHELDISGGYYRAEQTGSNANPYPRLLRALNLQSYNASFGGIYKMNAGDIQINPTINYSYLLLAQSTYLRSRGVGLTLSDKLNPLASVSLEANYSRQLYNRTSLVIDGDRRSGDAIEAGGDLGVVLTPSMKVDLSFTHTTQGALSKFYAYRRESITISHSWLLGKGQFILSSFTANQDRYDTAQLTISPSRRNDNTYRARASYGFPLALIAQPLKNAIFTFTYEYYQAISNISNYAYSDNKVSGLLTYKWDLGF